MQYFYAEGDQQKGPVDEAGLRAAGIKRDTLVWHEGMSSWQEAGSIAELSSLFPVAPVSQAPSPYAPRTPAQPTTMSPPPANMGFSQAPTGMQPTGMQPTGVQPTGVQPTGGYPSTPGYPPHSATPGQISYGGYSASAAPQPAPPQGMSIASMVLGILAIPLTFCYVGPVLAIIAVILGHMGAAQAKRITGRSNGMATAGLVCGYISLVICGLLVLLLIIGLAASGAH